MIKFNILNFIKYKYVTFKNEDIFKMKKLIIFNFISMSLYFIFSKLLY